MRKRLIAMTDERVYCLKDLVLAMTFIAPGLAVLAWLIRHLPPGEDVSIPIFLICWLGGRALVGAGVPFTQMRQGGVAGALVVAAMFVVMKVAGLS